MMAFPRKPNGPEKNKWCMNGPVESMHLSAHLQQFITQTTHMIGYISSSASTDANKLLSIILKC